MRTLNQCGRLEQLFRMFDGYRLDILGVSEVRWTKSGRINCDGMTFMYIGHEDRHEHGVGLVLSRRATGALVGWTPVSDWTITARFAYGHEKATIVQAYAPTDCAEEISSAQSVGA